MNRGRKLVKESNGDRRQITDKKHKTMWLSRKKKREKDQREVKINIKHIACLWSQTIVNFKMHH